jgi:dehydrogenase/reductase SDR family protein 7
MALPSGWSRLPLASSSSSSSSSFSSSAAAWPAALSRAAALLLPASPAQALAAALAVALVLALLALLRVALADADLATLAALRRMPRANGAAFKDKVVWITGASSGIGEQLAYGFASRGARLVLSARRVEELLRVATECHERGAPEVEALRLDVTAGPDALAAVAAHVWGQPRFGRVDVLVCAAGRRQHGLVVPAPPARELSPAAALEARRLAHAEDEAVMRLNVLGTMAVAKAALPHMLKQEGGGVVAVVSSIAGKVGSPISATYSASKHALQGFVDSARMELAFRGVRFVSLCPGPVQGAPGGSAADEASADATRMPRERCADLMCAAVWAELREAWIAPQPVLLFAYIKQLWPWLYFAIGPAIGRRRVAAFEKHGSIGYGAVGSVLGLASEAAMSASTSSSSSSAAAAADASARKVK